MEKPKDDLDAVRIVVQTLEQFDKEERERIIRWAAEKLGMQLAGKYTAPTVTVPGQQYPREPVDRSEVAQTDLKSFVAAKGPKSETHFATTVAYYYRFEAPEDDHKEYINRDDLAGAVRTSKWGQGLRNPGQTLINAYHAGLLDKTAGRGQYRLNMVGENLVAVLLPLGGAPASASKPTKRAKKPSVTRKSTKAKKSGLAKKTQKKRSRK